MERFKKYSFSLIVSFQRNECFRNVSTLQNQHKQLFESLSKILNIKSKEDWYCVGSEDIKVASSKANSVLREYYKGSIIKAVTTVFPEFHWELWRFNKERLPSGFWLEKKNQRSFLDFLAKKLDIKTDEDWYKVKKNDFLKYNGYSLLMEYYGGSFIRLLQEHFPHIHWQIWRFQKAPNGFWKDEKNWKQFVEWFSKEANIHTMEDWYSVKHNQILEKGGSALLHQSRGIYKLLKTVYPNYDWKPWKFEKAPQNSWNEESDRRTFFEYLTTEFGIQNWKEWYEVTKEKIIEKGGSGVLSYYGNSHIRALITLYPEYPWQIWNFKQVPVRYWENIENVNEFTKHIEDILGISSAEHWQQVSSGLIRQLGGFTLLKKHHGLAQFLENKFPDKKLEFQGIPRAKYQRLLFNTLSEIFTGEDVHLDYEHPTILFPQTGRNIELDIYLPKFSLAFEYQGEYHYFRSFHYDPEQTIHVRDSLKKGLCEGAGITLIPVPFWWDLTKDSLVALISKHRKDLAEKYQWKIHEEKAIPDRIEMNYRRVFEPLE